MATTPTTPKTNRLGLAVLDYRGSKTTLCAGCGHNAISERIVEAMFEMGVEPEFVIKPIFLPLGRGARDRKIQDSTKSSIVSARTIPSSRAKTSKA